MPTRTTTNPARPPSQAYRSLAKQHLPARPISKMYFSLAARALLTLLISMAFATAAPIAIQAKDALDSQESFLTSKIGGAVCLVVGFLFCFFGTKMWRVTVFLAGFFIFMTLGASLMLNIEMPVTKDKGFGNNRDWIILGSSVAIGLIGGILAAIFTKVGIFLIGAMGGAMVGLWVLAFVGDSAAVIRILVLLVLAIAGALLTLKYEKEVVIVSTAFAGAFLIMLGIDCFTDTGFREGITLILGSGKGKIAKLRAVGYLATGGLGLMIGAIALAIFGAVVQWKRYTGFSK